MYTGYIYRHFIEIDGIEYSYVGQTTQEPEDRWQDGWGYLKEKTKFAKAIVAYGWNNFEHEIIVEIKCKTKDELKETLDNLEEMYIENYDSCHCGFNSNLGGRIIFNNTTPLKKAILINTGEIFDCAKDASQKYNLEWKDVQKCCRNVKKSCGKHPITKEKLYWAYYTDEEDFEKPYNYICINDNKKYFTYEEMSKVYNFSINQIRLCCIGKKEYLTSKEGEKIFFKKI